MATTGFNATGNDLGQEAVPADDEGCRTCPWNQADADE